MTSANDNLHPLADIMVRSGFESPAVQMRGGPEAGRQAHNLKFGGSNPPRANWAQTTTYAVGWKPISALP